MPPPRAPIITGTIITVYPGLLSLVSKASCQHCIRLSLHFVSIFFCMGYAMSQIQIFFSYFVSSIKLGLLAVSDFRRLNRKSQTSFALSFSKIIPRSHQSLYHTVSAPINLCSFTQVTGSIVSTLLSLVKYSLLNKAMHSASRCFTVSSCTWDTRHLPSSTSPWAAFQDLVSTICSSIDMIDNAFWWVKILSQLEMAFLLLFSKESTLLIFRLVHFDSDLFSTHLKCCFHSFPCQFLLLFDPLTIQLYRIVLEFKSHVYFFHCCSCSGRNSIFCLQCFPSPGSLDPPIFQLWHASCHS